MIETTSEKQNNNSTLSSSTQAKDTILLVDDDPLILDSMALLLKKEFNVVTASDRPTAITILREKDQQNINKDAVDSTTHNHSNYSPKVALIDMGLPPKPHAPDEGFALISDLLAFDPSIKILVLSGQDRNANVETALQLGAVDYISKPAKPPLLRERINQQIEVHNQEHSESNYAHTQLVGTSAAMQGIHQQITNLANSPFPALILGESGTGKELIAQAIHNQSSRSDKSFVPINCAAVPSELIESILFGHVKGAFTNAHKDSIGFFGEASNGSIFLDELGDLPTALQAKLLRVLENGEYYRIGETNPRKTDARVIAATNSNLKQAIEQGLFRADLYHRLSILTINVPPLRARTEDIREIISYFIETYKDTFPPFRLSCGALEILESYSFPGNIRELRNIVIRLGTKYPGATIGQSHIQSEIGLGLQPKRDTTKERAAEEAAEEVTEHGTHQPAEPTDTNLNFNPDRHEASLKEAPQNDPQSDTAPPLSVSFDDQTIETLLQSNELKLDELLTDLEKRCISVALRLNENNLSKTARALHINRSTLHSRIQKYDENR